MVVKSQEGTTHCDPKVTTKYGVAILFLIDMLEIRSWTCNSAQLAFSLESLQNFLDNIIEHGGAFAYIVLNYHLITNQKLFKRPINWIVLELDDDVIEVHSVLGPAIGFW